MSLKEYYSKLSSVFSRRAIAKSGQPVLSDEDRTRIMLLYSRAVANLGCRGDYLMSGQSLRENYWIQVHQSLQDLNGRVQLSDRRSGTGKITPEEDIWYYLATASLEQLLDFVEITFQQPLIFAVFPDPNELVNGINELFRQANLPYLLTRIKVNRKLGEPSARARVLGINQHQHVTSFPQFIARSEDVIHQEAIKPALEILSESKYHAANSEYRQALRHHREGRYGDCLTSCASALESVLKVLISGHTSRSEEGLRISHLVDEVCKLLDMPPFLKKSFQTVSVMRNEMGSAHGGGKEARRVESHYAQYAITTTASTIVLLVNEMETKTK